MPYQPLQILPGYYTDGSRIDSSNRYIDGNHVRFFKGFAKKIGGSVKQTLNKFLGLCRFVSPWVTLTDRKYIALGTNLKLYINDGGTLYDITPIRSITNPMGNNPFATINVSSIVTVTDTANGSFVGDFVTFSGATTVAGLNLNGNWQIQSIVDDNTYTVDVVSLANNTTSGGGNVVVAAYEIHVGSADSAANIGWGADNFSDGTFGTPRVSMGILQFARTWSGGNYGEDLIISPRGGSIYVWIAADGTGVRAQLITEAPLTNEFIVVSAENRYVISLGAYDQINMVSNPMLIAWCSQDDYHDWTATTINTAGTNPLSNGNLLMCGVVSRGSVIISSDTTIYQMYPNSQFVFAFNTIGIGGCVSPNGMIEFNGVVYWWGTDNFFSYAGTINLIPCDVRSYVFNNLNVLQSYKIYAWVNSAWNEIWWFWPDNTSTECNRYVAYDYLQGVWHYGTRNMTAGHDKGVVTNNPISTGSNGYTYNLEAGTDEDGLAMDTLLITGSSQVQTRNKYAYVRKIIPNFQQLVGTTSMSIITRLYPQDSEPITSLSYTVDSSTTFISTRMRGDEFSVQYKNSQVGSDFWLGTPELEVMATGTR